MNNYYNQQYSYQQNNYSHNNYGTQPTNNFQMNLINHPANFLNSINPTNPIHPMIQIPTSLMRPSIADPKQANNLGFQMNPVSKNKKK
jgi:hypothetical protein